MTIIMKRFVPEYPCDISVFGGRSWINNIEVPNPRNLHTFTSETVRNAKELGKDISLDYFSETERKWYFFDEINDTWKEK